MSTAAGGLNIVTNGLVMYLDAANTKSLSDVPSTNLITWSEDFTNANWGKSNLSVSGNTISSPIGTITADSLIENSLLAQHATTKTVTVTSGNTFTYSIYLKPNSRFNSSVWVFDSNYVNGFGGNFNLTAGTVTNISQGTGISNNTNQITNVGNGWYRCKITGTITTATTFNLAVFLVNNSSVSNYSGDGVSNLYVWGAQLEVGLVATTYIPTTTAAVSRVPTWTDISRGGNNGTLGNNLTYDYSNGGSLVFNGVSSFITIPNPINQSNLLQEWTVMAWINISDKTNQTLLGGLNLGLYVCYSQGNNSLLYLNSGLSNDYYTYGGDLGGIGWVLVSFIFKNLTGERYIYRNGVNITTTGPNTSSIPVGISSTLVIGQMSTGNLTSGFQGLLSNIQIYNRALSAQEVLQNYNTTKSKFGL